MSEAVWSVHDFIILIICIIVIIGLIVIDFLFCTIFNGFCILRWWLNFLITSAYNSTSNLFLKGILYGLLRAVDLIPL